ncbi:universal stress protein [Streptomyces goshikiensis]|uniref:universal stress protein n=1 Tax=Streptomyces goshikiensis TaxID=1942 RepID=UPI003660FC04
MSRRITVAAAGAAIIVAGRRIRRSALGGARVGPITHAVIHHARSPVAVAHTTEAAQTGTVP